jgi:hypothetical protein
MQKIILVGFQGCGKNTAGEYLVEKYGYTGLSFADALKDAVASIFCWDRAMLEGNTPEARVWREAVDPWWEAKLGIPGFTPRWMLRNFGTDIMRQHFNPNIWTANVERRILDLGDKPVVVFDGRFPNEVDLVTDMGGRSVRVRRGPEPSWFGTAAAANSDSCSAPFYQQILNQTGIHRSETAWVGHPIDITIENEGSIDDLHRKVDDLVILRYSAAA